MYTGQRQEHRGRRCDPGRAYPLCHHTGQGRLVQGSHRGGQAHRLLFGRYAVRHPGADKDRRLLFQVGRLIFNIRAPGILPGALLRYDTALK